MSQDLPISLVCVTPIHLAICVRVTVDITTCVTRQSLGRVSHRTSTQVHMWPGFHIRLGTYVGWVKVPACQHVSRYP